MFNKSFARARNDELDREFIEFDRELIESLRTRTPMHDRPGRQRKGSQRLGDWIAAVGTRLADR